MSLEDKIRKVEPYVAGEQPKVPGLIKLNTNECPYPPSGRVKEALRLLEEESEKLRLYPDMNAQELVDAIAAHYGVDPERVFAGVGSDDVLSMCFLTFFTGGEEILFPDVTYSFYEVWAGLYRIPYRLVPLCSDFTIDPEDYIPADKGGRAPGTIGGIIFPNPNAPTGIELGQEDIERIVSANPDCVVIVDEAYVDFGARSALSLTEKYDNLLVVQTFSKSRAMAGSRIGFAIGSPGLIGYLKDVKFSFNSYTLNLQAIRAGRAAVEDDEYFREITGKVVQTREWFAKELKNLGFEMTQSRTNFLFAKPLFMDTNELFLRLRENKVLVRHWDRPRIGDYLRITIGTDDDMREVINIIRRIKGED